MENKQKKGLEQKNRNNFTRRNFLQITAGGLALTTAQPVFAALQFIDDVDNPLDFYPAKDWEKIYRDQFKHDSTSLPVCTE